MIDLRDTNLPDCLEVDGEVFPILTDFRTWLSWTEDYNSYGLALPYVFKDDMPIGGTWEDDALAFASADVATPKADKAKSNRRVLDLILDGDYIVGSFQQAYGIDLTNPKCFMHWWRFMALLRSLPDGTMVNNIIGYRSYDSAMEKRKPETAHKKLKQLWALPEIDTASKEHAISWQQAAFGKALSAWEVSNK